MNYDVRFYRTLVMRRLPAMVLIIGLFTAIGVVLAMRLPAKYESQARLLVEGPQIAERLAASTVQTGMGEQIEILRQNLLSRETLIDIANDLNVFPEGAPSPNDVVERMRDWTTIEATGGRNAATFVTVAFRSGSPETSAAVVNEYVTRLLEENVRSRTDTAGKTLSFFEQEVERLSDELKVKSDEILEYKTANADALPDGQTYRLSRQETLTERATRLERDLEGIEKQRTLVAQMYEQTGRVDPGARGMSRAERRLMALEDELSEARAVLSASNPKITLLESQIESLSTEVARQQGNFGGEGMSLYDITVAGYDEQVTDIKDELAGIEEELVRINDAVQRTPQVGIVLGAMERDYNNIRNQYDNAVQRVAAAETGERIEVTAQGQRITLADEPTVPTSPASPNRPLVAAAGVGAGLAGAAGLFLLLELLNTTVRRPTELVGRLGITPIASIPYIETRASRRIRAMRQFAMVAVVLVALPLALWAIDTFYAPLDVALDSVLMKLGLI